MNPPVDPPATVTSSEAARLLGVKVATVYAYASRGLLRGQRERGRTGTRYRSDDVIALKLRSGARAGHAAVASGALGFGEPILDSSITFIGGDGPVYRGHVAATLARKGVGFERTARLLWTGTLEKRARFAVDVDGHAGLPVKASVIQALLPARPSALAVLEATLAALAQRAPRFVAPPATEMLHGGALLLRLAASLAFTHDAATASKHLKRALDVDTVAERVALALTGKAEPALVAAIERMLVVCSDHELNSSTFGARVAASCGASLHACLTAGLAVLSGPKHGGMLDRVEVLFDEVARPKRALEVVLAHLQRGDALPGFGHILYPQGDPRSLPLLELARVQKSEGAAVSRAVMAAMHELIGDTPLSHPAVDYAVVTTCRGYGLPSGTATALFALGRTAGWIAHVLEQRESLLQIRPRARFRES